MTASNASPSTTQASDREIVISRVLDAPRELVFEAFTELEHVAQWWGPNGFTTTTHKMDVRPGGVWRFAMHGPDGVDYENKIVYTEVVKPERLAWDHGDGEKVMFQATVTFDEQDGKTRVTLRHHYATAEERNESAKYAVEGGKQTLDRLAAYVAKL